jgi:hypothetical protein
MPAVASVRTIAKTKAATAIALEQRQDPWGLSPAGATIGGEAGG